MRTLITGIDGQDGGYLADQLVDAGYEVHGLVRDRDSTGTEEPVRRSPTIILHVGNLEDVPSVKQVMRMVDRTRCSTSLELVRRP